ncbi:MAG: carbohydrate binding family 9 domain-containing protein [Fimbriimonadales bacterium]
MRFSLSMILTFVATLSLAQNREIPGKELTKPPVIDGVISEVEWAEAAESGGFVDPVTGKETEFDTKVLAGYDSSNIYFAVKATDPSPNLIRMSEYRRGADMEGDDKIVVVINPYGTFREEDFSEFEVNPRGAARADFAGGRASKREWEGDWEAAGKATASGYEVEIRIPWRILRLPSAGTRNLTFNFGRYIARKQQELFWANLGTQERFELSGIWKDVKVPAVQTGSVIQALPYQVAGLAEDGHIFNTGVDLRYQVGSQITTLATINPDFANVESAVLGIEFSRFERLADERRPFFVEGSSFFGIGGMSARLFAPQRIGQIDFGAKGFGQITANDSIGALVTGRLGEETAGVFRYRKTFGPRASINAGYVGFDDPEGHNHAYGIEAYYDGPRWGGDLIFSQTDDELVGVGSRLDADITYGDGTLFAFGGWQRISEDFLPRLGFAPRKGFQGFSMFAGYEKEWRSGPFRHFEIGAEFVDRLKENGNGVFERGQAASISFSQRNGLFYGVDFENFNFEGDIVRVAGFGIGYPSDDPNHRIEMGGNVGEVEGEDYHDVALSATYRFPNRLTTSAALQFVRETGQNEFQHIFGATYELSEFRSVSGRAIVGDQGVNWYVAFRQSGNLGTEYYLIIGDPRANSFENKVVLKVVTPLTIKL